MPDLDKGQHGSVPIVLERPFADVQDSAHVSVVQQVGHFGLRAELFSHAKSQFFDALFQFLSGGGVDGCKSHINIIFNCHFHLVWCKCTQSKSLLPAPMKAREIEGSRRQMYKHELPNSPTSL